MAGFRRSSTPPSNGGMLVTTGSRTAVETIRDGGRATRTHVQYAPLFVLAQDYDDVIRSLRGALDPPEFTRLSHEDQLTLTLFTSIARVIGDMVARGEHIARLTKVPDPVGAEGTSLESLQARQYTEQALVNEGQAALAEDIALLRAKLAEARVDHRAESARQLLDVAPFPQPGSAAAELSVLLSSNRARHRS